VVTRAWGTPPGGGEGASPMKSNVRRAAKYGIVLAGAILFIWGPSGLRPILAIITLLLYASVAWLIPPTDKFPS
jgi:hypothetical protein